MGNEISHARTRARKLICRSPLLSSSRKFDAFRRKSTPTVSHVTRLLYTLSNTCTVTRNFTFSPALRNTTPTQVAKNKSNRHQRLDAKSKGGLSSDGNHIESKELEKLEVNYYRKAKKRRMSITLPSASRDTVSAGSDKSRTEEEAQRTPLILNHQLTDELRTADPTGIKYNIKGQPSSQREKEDRGNLGFGDSNQENVSSNDSLRRTLANRVKSDENGQENKKVKMQINSGDKTTGKEENAKAGHKTHGHNFEINNRKGYEKDGLRTPTRLTNLESECNTGVDESEVTPADKDGRTYINVSTRDKMTPICREISELQFPQKTHSNTTNGHDERQEEKEDKEEDSLYLDINQTRCDERKIEHKDTDKGQADDEAFVEGRDMLADEKMNYVKGDVEGERTKTPTKERVDEESVTRTKPLDTEAAKDELSYEEEKQIAEKEVSNGKPERESIYRDKGNVGEETLKKTSQRRQTINSEKQTRIDIAAYDLEHRRSSLGKKTSGSDSCVKDKRENVVGGNVVGGNGLIGKEDLDKSEEQQETDVVTKPQKEDSGSNTRNKSKRSVNKETLKENKHKMRKNKTKEKEHETMTLNKESETSPETAIVKEEDSGYTTTATEPPEGQQHRHKEVESEGNKYETFQHRLDNALQSNQSEGAAEERETNRGKRTLNNSSNNGRSISVGTKEKTTKDSHDRVMPQRNGRRSRVSPAFDIEGRQSTSSTVANSTTIPFDGESSSHYWLNTPLDSEPLISKNPFEDKFDADCIVLRQALFGKKVDKTTLTFLLSNRSRSQREKIRGAYNRRYDQDLIEDVKQQLSGDFASLLVAILQDQSTNDAALLNFAFTGMGTNESVLIYILASRSPKELVALKQSYSEMYSHDADLDVKGDTSGSFQILCLVQLNKGEEDGSRTDEKVAEQDANRMWKPGERPVQEHEDVLIEILTSFNADQYALVSKFYMQNCEIDIPEAIRRSTRGDFRNALLAMASYMQDSVGYHADLLQRALRSFRRDDRILINIVVSRQEIDLNLINLRFHDNCGKTLEEAVSSSCKGDYRKLLLSIIARAGIT